MENFEPVVWLVAQDIMASVEAEFRRHHGTDFGRQPVGSERKAEMLRLFTQFGDYIRGWHLVASNAAVDRIVRHCNDDAPISRDDLASLIIDLKQRTKDELMARTFLALSPTEARLYEEPRSGWDGVIARFPETLMDIEEASKCMALSRYPAAVFHSLQIVEIGVIAVGRFLNVRDPRPGWTATTREIDRVLKTDYRKRTRFERRHYGFLEQIQATIEALNNAWRNKISHADGKLILLREDFSIEIASDILLASRGFMRRLAVELPDEVAPRRKKSR